MKIKMNIFEDLPDITLNHVLKFLNSRDLTTFSLCCKSWRDFSNKDIFWRQFCISEGLEKYEYLLDKQAHPSVPINSIANGVTPIFKLPDYEIITKPCRWKMVYLKAKHLIKNWRSGHYTVGPVLKAHKGRVTAFDSDGTYLVSGSSDEKLVKVWSIEDAECIYTIKSQLDSINSIKIHKKNFILAGDDGVIRVYEISSGDLKKKIALSDLSIAKLYICNEKLIALVSDKSIRVWSLKNFEILQILRGHEDEIECLNFYDSFMISGSWDKKIILWNLSNGKKLLTLKDHTEVINCLKMRDNLVVSGSSDSTLKIFKIIIDKDSQGRKTILSAGEPISLEGHESDVYCLDFNEEYIVSSGADSKVLVWNFSGKLLHQLVGHLGVVRYIFIDDFKLVTGGDAKKIMVWDYKKGKLLNTLFKNPNRLHLMWLNDTLILTASPENESNLTMILYW